MIDPEIPWTWECLYSTDAINAFAHLIESLGPDSYIAIDTETGAPHADQGDPKAALKPYVSAYITGISFCIVRTPAVSPPKALHGVYVPVAHRDRNPSPEAVRRLCEALSATGAVHVFHHAAFDWATLAQIGTFRRVKRTVDTQVWRWLQDENAPKALKVMGEMYLGEDASREQRELAEAKRSPWKTQTEAYRHVRESFPEWPLAEAKAFAKQMRRDRKFGDEWSWEMAPYAAFDPVLTVKVAAVLGLDPLDPAPALVRKMAVLDLAARMTERGVSVDIGQLEAAGILYEERAEEIRERWEAKYGPALHAHRCKEAIYAGKPEPRYQPLNMGSSQQMAVILYDVIGIKCPSYTASGMRSTSKEALEQIAGYPEVFEVIEYGKWKHAAASYARPWAEFARRSHDGRIHGMYEVDRTDTGRFAANFPNVMTIPRDDSLPEIRHAFYTSPGEGLSRMSFDIVSAELWIGLDVTGDPKLGEILLAGRDMHTEMALDVFGTIEGGKRTLAKNCNYGMDYGAGIGRLQVYTAKAGYPPAEARAVASRIYNAHQRMFKVKHAVSDFLAERAEADGIIPLHEPGRYRHYRGPRRPPGYTALNSIVQGGVAEHIQNVMLRLADTPWEQYLILQVHDELVFDAPTGSDEAILAEVQRISDEVNVFKYPLKWDAKVWA